MNQIAIEIRDGGGTDGIITNPFLKGSTIETFTGEEFLQGFLPSMVGLLMVFGTVAFLFMLLSGSISWILSGGDKAKIESAKGRITSSLVGIIVMLATFAIVRTIELFFDINILSIDIGPLIIE